ncbi:MAG: phosphotransferase [Vicinamibacterales bacterium]
MSAPASVVPARLAPDAALPERDRLLDPAEAAALLARAYGVAFDRVVPLKTKYRVGDSLRVSFRVTRGDDTWWVAARMAPGMAARWHAEARASARPDGELAGVALDEASGTMCWTFPNDRKLRTAGRLLAGETVARAAFPGLPTTTTLVSVTPERAAVARIAHRDTGESLGFAKVYADEGAAAAASCLGRLGAAIASRGVRLSIPAVRWLDEPGRMLAVTAVPGRPLSALDLVAVPRAMRALGRALATLHALPAAPVPAFDRFDTRALLAAAEDIGRARPDVAGAARRAAARLTAGTPAAAAAVTLHGDVNSHNWLVHDGAVGFIDLDEARTGPAAADIAGHLASLRYRTLTRLWTPDAARRFEREFLDGYAEVRPLPEARALAWHVAAALFVERALRAVARVRRDGLAVLDAVIDEAARLAREARHA